MLVVSSDITAYDTTTPVQMQRAGRIWISPGLKYKFVVHGNLTIQDSDVGYLWGLADPPPEIGGIQIYSNDAIIRNSFIHNGAVHGLYAQGASNIMIFNTAFSGNNVSGIATLGSQVSVGDSTITRNDEYGMRGFYGGGTASDISVVSVKNSIVNRNGFTGIDCWWCKLELDNNNVSYNGKGESGFGVRFMGPIDSRIENNTRGIEILGAGTHPEIVNNSIVNNSVGIFLWLGGNATVHGNNIYDNDWGMSNLDDTIMVNATENWWGDSGGPDDDSWGLPDYNDNNAGDDVSDYIIYRPWLHNPAF